MPTQLGRKDYADAFLVDVPAAEQTAEAWIRAMLQGAPPGMRLQLIAAWTALGLKLNPTGRSILGWPIRTSDDDHILLGADSRVGMPAELLMFRRDDGLLFGTRARHDNPVVRRVWAAVEPSHVQTVRWLLGRIS
ncbi:hypothetical protein [Mycolicibacterium phlei]